MSETNGRPADNETAAQEPAPTTAEIQPKTRPRRRRSILDEIQRSQEETRAQATTGRKPPRGLSAIQAENDAAVAAGETANEPATAGETTEEEGRRGTLLDLTEAATANECAETCLQGRFCWSAGLGWLHYDGRRWAVVPEPHVVEEVRLWMLKEVGHLASAPKELGKSARRLLSRSGLSAVTALAGGILAVPASAFDTHPDLLNVTNGVVDLRTGVLGEHDPTLLLTKIAPVAYDPDAVSADWSAALQAVEATVADWLQVRLGQAATGYTPPDDLLVLFSGGGANGKTTILSAVQRTLGDYSTLVSDRVLLANPDAHPTEIMELRGARLAVIEETPEARRLSVARLKKVVGTPRIEARLMRQDSVTFTASHALVVSSNYRPVVEETDHGTWRRLALVPFMFTFVAPGKALQGPHERTGDPTLRERLAASPEAASAVLAWLVAGARRWYADGRVMPAAPGAVQAATRAWRQESDLVLGYLDERLVVEPGAHVMAAEALADFNDWATERGHQPWSERTFAARFGDHAEVTGHRILAGRARPGVGLSRRHGWAPAAPSARYRAWLGVRFRTDTDPETTSAESVEGSELQERDSGTGGTAIPNPSLAGARTHASAPQAELPSQPSRWLEPALSSADVDELLGPGCTTCGHRGGSHRRDCQAAA